MNGNKTDIIYKLLVILMSLALIQPAVGSIKSMNEDISELELESEVEDQELFDELTMAQEEQKLDKNLKGETRKLEGNIHRLNRQKKNAVQRHKQLTRRRKASEKVYYRVSDKAAKAEAERNREASKTNKLLAKVERIEQKAIAARDKKIAYKIEISQLKKQQRALNKRLRNAERIIKKHKKTIKKLKSQKSRLKNKVAVSTVKVDKLERKAIAKRNQLRKLR